MKPRIAIFGLPKVSMCKLKILVHKNPNGTYLGEVIHQTQNKNSDYLIEYLNEPLEIGDSIIIQIMSFGIKFYYSQEIKFLGADISLVPTFEKETNLDKGMVSEDCDYESWSKWNPKKDSQKGFEMEKTLIRSREISVAPIWESYFIESKIDYGEKFHKLWIGLNAYASQFSNERRDGNKILALVKSDLRNEFNSQLKSVINLPSAEKWEKLGEISGYDVTSEIVRDEINGTNSSLDFLERAKNSSGLFSNISKELEGLTFLNKGQGKDVFQDVFSRYHQYMASPTGGLSEIFNLHQAFENPKSPQSIERVGRLIYHNPFKSNSDGVIFSLKDFFGQSYEVTPYSGQNDDKLKDWELIDPLFFKYLLVLYKFRCTYFHGELSPNRQNDELAKSAYESLYLLYNSIV